MKKLSFFLILALMTTALQAQKPSIDHSVYDDWKSVGRITVPEDGEWAWYMVSPQQGDAVLHIYNAKSGREFLLERASQLKISKDAKTAVFKIAPQFAQTRQAKIDKKKPDEMPKDSLGVIDLTTGEIHRFPLLKSFRTAEDMESFIAFRQEQKPAPKGEKAPKDSAKSAAAKPEKSPKDNLYILNIKTLEIDTVKCVDKFFFSHEGDRLAFVTKPGKKDSLTKRGVFMYEPQTKEVTEVLTGEKESTFGSVFFNEKADKMVFYANLDTAKGSEKLTDIYLYEGGKVSKIVDRSAKGLKKGWKISDTRRIDFRNDDNTILIGTLPVPREKDTTLVAFEQPKLDIWRWNDDYIQPVQKSNLSRIKGQTYLAMVDLNAPEAGIVQLADEDVPNINFGEDNISGMLIVSTDKPYRMQQQWNRNPRCDLYAISLKDGSRTLLEKDVHYTAISTSPDGRYVVYYNSDDRNWYQYNVADGTKREISSKLGVIFWDEDNDTPSEPRPYSGVKWSEDSDFYLIRDRFDYWQFDPTGKAEPFLFTEGAGRAADKTYSIVNPYSVKAREMAFMTGAANLKKDKAVYFSTFNHTTKQTGYAVKEVSKKKAKLQQLVEGPYTYGDLVLSAGKKPVLIYTRACFEDGRNIWMTKDNFKTQIQLTDANPQQRDYNWGTVELVNWMTEDGIRAEGLLFKPENFDATKKYPVMIYFYEKYSDDLYASRVPAPSASTVNIPYFVSNEYICFIPDIYYTDGHPGKSCMKSLMPACDMLCSFPWVDGDNMAIQGQSWGGYQVAYIITQTNRFKAAGAGAPVSNMTSAYGGIRWESGMARTFQYEQQQSRIGDDLWHGFDLYVENSPLFFVPKVTTPVLIMHNDADGAVPWWQGIELFNGLRRCGKQAWLLQYNDEAHNLRERRNRKDLSIRLEQFFDHFLKGKPAPIWMEKGVPAELKGIELGYGYENKEEE